MGCEADESGREAIFEVEVAKTLIFHQLALIVSAICMSLAVIISCFLILDHALHYLRPYEQKHIIRILFMVPVYAIISLLGLLFYTQVVYLELVRTCYEAYAVASFFTLMCHYIAPTLHEQKEYFRNVRPKPWVWPLNGVRAPRSGLTWFNIIYACIFQFCITRPVFAIIAGITQSQHRYCQQSSSPSDGHLWIVLLQGIFVLIAIYALIQFYKQLEPDLKPHAPFPKSLCIKSATFLGFWQIWLLNLLSSNKGPIKPTSRIASLDIHTAIPCMLLCFEMLILACAFHWAFPWKPYDLHRQLRVPERREEYAAGPHTALLEALDPSDYGKAAARGVRWVVLGVRHRKDDPSYMLGDEDEEEEKRRCEDDERRRHARHNARSEPGAEGRRGEGENGRLRQRRTVG